MGERVGGVAGEHQHPLHHARHVIYLGRGCLSLVQRLFHVAADVLGRLVVARRATQRGQAVTQQAARQFGLRANHRQWGSQFV